MNLYLILEVVGLIEYIPQKAAGRRTLPPISEPIPRTSEEN